MTIVKMTADVDEIIRKQIFAGVPLHLLRDELIQNHITVAQDADGHESRRVRIVGRYLPEIDVVRD